MACCLAVHHPIRQGVNPTALYQPGLFAVKVRIDLPGPLFPSERHTIGLVSVPRKDPDGT
jgi:hypothetical protein